MSLKQEKLPELESDFLKEYKMHLIQEKVKLLCFIQIG